MSWYLRTLLRQILPLLYVRTVCNKLVDLPDFLNGNMDLKLN